MKYTGLKILGASEDNQQHLPGEAPDIAHEPISRGEVKGQRQIGHCPDCNGPNVFEWEESWPCPKCSNQMTKGELVLLWD